MQIHYDVRSCAHAGSFPLAIAIFTRSRISTFPLPRLGGNGRARQIWLAQDGGSRWHLGSLECLYRVDALGAPLHQEVGTPS
eukprot:scaffold32631_cov36-Tisochrysis_lutea.AAC.6